MDTKKRRTKPIKSWWDRRKNETKPRMSAIVVQRVAFVKLCYRFRIACAGSQEEKKRSLFHVKHLDAFYSFHAIVCSCRLSMSSSFIVTCDLTRMHRRRGKKKKMTIEVKSEKTPLPWISISIYVQYFCWVWLLMCAPQISYCIIIYDCHTFQMPWQSIRRAAAEVIVNRNWSL